MSDDRFYLGFENEFRGSQEEVTEKLRAYLPVLQFLEKVSDAPALIDYGCGRGEWLRLLQSRNWVVRGVDTSVAMAEESRRQGSAVDIDDAVSHIGRQPEASVTLITGFHIAEHLPADLLRRFVTEARRVLAPGGVLILETPNPENFLVGSCRFYSDPTHIHPLPPRSLQFVADYAGFGRTVLCGLNSPAQQDDLPEAAAAFRDCLEVSHDYALIAQRIDAVQIDTEIDIRPVLVAHFDHDGVFADPAFGRFVETLAREGRRFQELERGFSAEKARLHLLLERFHAEKQRSSHLEDRFNALEARLDNMVRSTSWRITRPLRIAGHFISTGKRRIIGGRREDSAAPAAPASPSPPADLKYPVSVIARHNSADRPDFRRDRLRILLIKVDHIGDFFLSLRAFSVVRETWPGAHLTLVCAPATVTLAVQTGLFNQVIPFTFFPAYSEELRQAPAPAYGTIADSVRESYDIAIDLRHDGDTRPLLDFVTARFRAGFRSDYNEIPLDVVLPELEVPQKADFIPPHNEHRLLILVWMVIAAFPSRPHPARKLAEASSAAIPFDSSGYAILGTGGGTVLKKWPEENFVSLAQRIVGELGLNVVVIGGEKEKACGEAIAAAVPAARVLNLVGQVPIIDIAKLIEKAKVFIGNDTGTTHLSGSLGVPTVCLFSGVADERVWQPLGSSVTILKADVPCAPCRLAYLEDCKLDRSCMRSIDVDVVFSQVARLVQATWSEERG